MISKSLKIAIVVVVALISVLLAMIVYRMFFQFNRKKIQKYAEAFANSTGAPNSAYSTIIEGCEFILKSQDLSKQVLIASQQDGIDKEQALVNAAINSAYSYGFFAEQPLKIADTNE